MILLAERLAKRVALSDAELEFLESLARHPATFRRRHIIQGAGEPVFESFVLLSGWAITFSGFADGSRQVRRIHFPGDLLAMPSMAMRRHAESIEAVTQLTVAPFSRSRFADLFGQFPRLAAIMFIFAQAERVTYGDRLCSLGRLPCKGRMAFLVLDVLNRLRACDPSVSDAFQMHLTREHMGDITGMTAVHASRMWSELVSDGLITSDNGYVTICDEEGLVSLSGYVNRDTGLDFDWIPPIDRQAGTMCVTRLGEPAGTINAGAPRQTDTIGAGMIRLDDERSATAL